MKAAKLNVDANMTRLAIAGQLGHVSEIRLRAERKAKKLMAEIDKREVLARA
jgi:hypothetical protein